jgi:hypothetical protein
MYMYINVLILLINLKYFKEYVSRLLGPIEEYGIYVRTWNMSTVRRSYGSWSTLSYLSQACGAQDPAVLDNINNNSTDRCRRSIL